MKRQLTGKPVPSQPTSPLSETFSPESTAPCQGAVPLDSWTESEDQFLMELLEKMPKPSWISICRKINRAFKDKKRTIKGCQERARSLSCQRDSEFNQNEKIVLLVGLYFYKENCGTEICEMIKKSPKKISEKLEEMKENVENLILRESMISEDYYEKLETLILTDFIIKNAIQTELNIHDENVEKIQRFLQKNGFTNIEDFQQKIKCVIEKFVNKILEKQVSGINIQNSNENQEKDGLDELFHERVEEERGRSRNIYLHILAPTAEGQNQYLISIYFLPN